MADVKRVAVLVSGHGSNLQALMDAAADPSYGARVELVASDRPDAHGLERARAAGIPTAVVRPADFPDRAAFDEALAGLVAAARPDAVCLAGFMRILGPAFVRAFPGRIVNTHPSLLPAFRGAHAVRDALAYGVRVTGCTVHLVDEEVDHGPVLLQAAVAVRDGDDEASLHGRIKREEHRLLPAAVRLVALGRVRLDGRRAWLEGDQPAPPSDPPGRARPHPGGPQHARAGETTSGGVP
ncbi:MAG TPA: phosphoribosylglycinamide formyltransferase [Actinomycetota bacterium]|nr:phosphoribosylglycinamide formyltransferase [Actinomycetota bacterium]